MKIFEKFISQERHIRIFIWSALYLWFNLLLKSQLGSKSKYVSYENRNYVFGKFSKIAIFFSLAKFNWLKMFDKTLESSLFGITKVLILKFQIPTALVLKLVNQIWKCENKSENVKINFSRFPRSLIRNIKFEILFLF